MVRGKSVSYSSSATPFFEPAPARTMPRELKKTSSLADLKAGSAGKGRKWLRKFKSKGDFDFGCAGDGGSDDLVEEEEYLEIRDLSSRYQHQTLNDSLPPIPLTAPPTSYSQFPFPPIAPSPVLATPLNPTPRRLVPTDPEEYDRYRLQEEQRLAEEACLAYCTSASQAAHLSTVPARTSSLANDLNVMDQASHLSALNSEEHRSRSSSSASSTTISTSSSRPRTNESLPSSYNSEPSSPKLPYLGRRPSLAATVQATVTPLPQEADLTKRPYQFI